MQAISIYSISLGCPKNLVDTENMLGCLGSFYHTATSIEQADIVLINTCAFIEPAVEESIEAILKSAKQIKELEHPPLLVVTGCLYVRYTRELAEQIPEVDYWLDLSAQKDWLEIINYPKIEQIKPAPGIKKDVLPRVLSTAPAYAYLKISEGCRHNCSFCLIPKLRGPLRSRTREDILEEARQILDRGVKELCLVAQDLTAYALDLGEKDGLQRLLTQLVQLDGLHWLRMLYLYPLGLNRKFLAGMQELGPKLLPYFDLPIQHSHPEILAAMGRPFAREPRQLVELLREYFPDSSLRTSIIVGYPGETQAMFEHLLQFVQEVRFDHLGVFTFWPEQGTKSAALPAQVPEDVKLGRREEILKLQAEISRGKLASHVDEEMQVLVEKRHPEWPTLYTGRVWFQAPQIDGMTYLSALDVQPGQMVKARIYESGDYDLKALI